MKRLTDLRLLTRLASGAATPYYPVSMADLHARFAGLSLGPGDEIRIERRDEAKGLETVRRRTAAG